MCIDLYRNTYRQMHKCAANQDRGLTRKCCTAECCTSAMYARTRSSSSRSSSDRWACSFVAPNAVGAAAHGVITANGASWADGAKVSCSARPGLVTTVSSSAPGLEALCTRARRSEAMRQMYKRGYIPELSRASSGILSLGSISVRNFCFADPARLQCDWMVAMITPSTIMSAVLNSTLAISWTSSFLVSLPALLEAH